MSDDPGDRMAKAAYEAGFEVYRAQMNPDAILLPWEQNEPHARAMMYAYVDAILKAHREMKN